MFVVPGAVVVRIRSEAISLGPQFSTYCFGAACNALSGSADSVRMDDVPIIEIEPLTSPPVASGRKFVSTYCLGTACRAETGFCPKVRIAPEDKVISDPDESCTSAPEDRDMMLPEDKARSAPLASVTFWPSVCGWDLSKNVDVWLEKMLDTVALNSPAPSVISSEFVPESVAAVGCSTIAPASNLALLTWLFKFAAVTDPPCK